MSATVLAAPAGAADGTVTDTSVADFAAGDPASATVVVDTAGGEVILQPQEGAEFFGDALPADWSSEPWNPGGAAAVGGGALTVDGARAQVDALTTSGHSVEFTATFPAGDPFAHVGFGVTFNEAPWGMFSTGADGSQLLARTNTGTGPEEVTSLGADLLGGPHVFRVTWDADGFSYAVDGTPVATHAGIVTQELRPIASEYNSGGSALTVDWLRLSPFATAGLYTSRVFDAGAAATWTAAWEALTPGDTSVALQVQTGDSAAPDDDWSAWVVATPGDLVGGGNRYARYRAALAGDGTQSPTLQSVSLAYTLAPQNAAPVAQNSSGATAENAPVKVKFVATDADGDALSYVVVGNPQHGTLSGGGSARKYSPAAGFTGTDTFTYRASDGTNSSNLATVTVTVEPLARPRITALTPDRGPVGTVVQIDGTDFLGTTDVRFQGVRAEFRVTSDTVILTKVPAGAKSGRVKVINPDFSRRSDGQFTVTR